MWNKIFMMTLRKNYPNWLWPPQKVAALHVVKSRIAMLTQISSSLTDKSTRILKI